MKRLYEKYYNYLFIIAKNKFKLDDDRANIAVNETFMRFKTKNFNPEISNIKTYLYTILRNNIYILFFRNKGDIFNNKFLKVDNFEKGYSIFKYKEEDDMFKNYDNIINLCHKILKKIEETRIKKKSNTNYLELYELRYIYNYSYKEIANILNIKLNVVKCRIHHMHQYLRNYFGEYNHESEKEWKKWRKNNYCIRNKDGIRRKTLIKKLEKENGKK